MPSRRDWASDAGLTQINSAGTTVCRSHLAGVPRFFLSLRDGDFLPDLEGQEFADVEAAKAAALRGAREMMAEDVKQGFLHLNEAVEITDGEGVLRAKLRFREAVSIVS